MVNNVLCYDYKDKYNIPIGRLFLIFFLFRYLFLYINGYLFTAFAPIEMAPGSTDLSITTIKTYTNVHIAIAGNIGSGKTTLTTMLAKHYGWIPRFEPVDINPYLEDYYKDIARWSFCLEVYFLKQRFRDLLEIRKSDRTVVQDRSIYEGVYVFTANNRDMGNLSDRDYETYMELFEIMTDVAQLPDLMIYLRASVPHLVKNIQKRGRAYEQTMQLEYLKNLNQRYEDFIFNKYKGKVLVVEADDNDFQHDPDKFARIIERVDSALELGTLPFKDNE
jgi:deoxyadenosine/deoxycytidine kinase